jgi:lipopolysaccharide core heptose(I) kinase
MTPNAATNPFESVPRQALGASRDIRVAEEFASALAAMDLTSLDAFFLFDGGTDLVKGNIGSHRRRFQLEVTLPDAEEPTKLYLKRYDHPPCLPQLIHWLTHRRRVSLARIEHETACRLAAEGIGTPHTAACGELWGTLFEKRSFLMTRQVANAESLERKLPPYFNDSLTPSVRRQRRDFIQRLATFVKRFHETGYCHRDLYFSHIFCSTTGSFCLIDLARAFKPVLRRRFKIKDLAQLHYSAPRDHFSRTDRLRFYLTYCGRDSLEPADRSLLAAVLKKTARMARHNRKHRVPVPYLDRTRDGG